MKLVARSKAEQNRAAVDPWTIVHFASGLAAGLTRTPLPLALAAATAYELAEQVAERRKPVQKLFAVSGPETLVNSLTDLAVFVLGHRLGGWWNASGGGDAGGDRTAG